MASKQTQLRGIVEGFFSKPLPIWTNEQRLTTLRFISTYAPLINSYFYCPKEDPFITKKWAIPYPSKERSYLQKTITFCNRKNIEFVYGLNPPTPPLIVDKYVIDITNKFAQLQKLGCKLFCLLYDDIPLSYSLSEDIPDNSADQLARTITTVTNQVYKNLGTQDCSLWLCSPDYFFRSKNTFNQSLSKNLYKNIPLIWTGPQVFVKNIANSQIIQAQQVISGRELVLWLNYPVNDYPRALGTLNLGGLPELNPTATEKLKAIFINPMRETYLNFPFYITFNDWIKEKNTYNRASSYTQALSLLLNNQVKPANILCLASPNIVDPLPTPSPQVQKFTSNPIKIKNNYGKLFLKQLEYFYKKQPKFPINYKDAKYFVRSLSIIRSRLAIIGITSIPEVNKLIPFETKYKNANKTQITQTDRLEIVSLLSDLIKKESKLFLNATINMSPNKVAKLRRARSLINEFNLMLKFKL